jgi:hypothetical protein
MTKLPIRFGRTLPVVALAMCLTSATLADERREVSLAHYVPADVGLFVELRNADDLLIPLTKPEAWITVAELAGQPAGLSDTADWQARIRQTIGMGPTQAIETLFAKRVAFVGQGLLRSQDAVVLCEPTRRPRDLVRSWQAQPLPSAARTSVYRLPNRVAVAVQTPVVVFGNDTPTGMFSHVLSLLETESQPPLADDPLYRRLLARLPANPDGLFFMRLGAGSSSTSQPTSAPAVPSLKLPGPLRGSQNVLLALHRHDNLLHFSAVGDGPSRKTPHNDDVAKLVQRLPGRTLLAWGGQVDSAELLRSIQTLPKRHWLRVAYDIHDRFGNVEKLTDALAPAACIAIGAVSPRERQATAPAVPAAAVVVKLHNPAIARDEWEGIVTATISLHQLLTLKTAGKHVPPLVVTTEQYADVTYKALDLSAALSPFPLRLTPIGPLHLCWAFQDDTLILASHPEWLEQILDTRMGRGERLETVLKNTAHPAARHRENLLVAQTGPVADLGQLWLDELERFAPHVLEESFWKQYQPGGRPVRLGIKVRTESDERRLRVVSVTPGGAADGILQPNDLILGVNRRRFQSNNPLNEIRHGLAQRPHARWIDLYVEREGDLPRLRRVPLPFVDPVQIVRRLVSVGELFQRVVYSDDADSRGSLTVELRRDPKPLYGFGVDDPNSAKSEPLSD